MLNAKVLVLNSNWVPICTMPVRDVMTLACRGGANIICPISYEIFGIETWIIKSASAPRITDVILTPNVAIHLPEVVLLTEFGGVPQRSINFSRRNIYRRDDSMCQYCAKKIDLKEMTIDHVMPKSLGGPSSWVNCVVACSKCNTKKAAKTLKEAGMVLLKTPKKPNWSTAACIDVKDSNPTWDNFLKTR